MGNPDNAKQILEAMGGRENVINLTHCATRLRFSLKDASDISKSDVEKIPGVLGAVPQGDTNYQIIIGGGVAQVYNAITELPEYKNAKVSNTQQKTNAELKTEIRSKRKGGKLANSFFEYLSDSFRPLIGVLLAASLVIACLNLLISLGVIANDTANPTTMFFKAIAQGVFYFLPIMVAYNAGKKLNIDPWVSAMIMMILMTPHFLALKAPSLGMFGTQAEVDIATAALSTWDPTNGLLGTKGVMTLTNILGIPMVIADYSGSVFVPLIVAPVAALFYKLCLKIIPSSVQMVFVPTITIVITSLIAGYLLGPIGVFVGNFIGMGISWLNSVAPYILIIITPIIHPFLVPLGLHWPINALMLMNIQSLGYDMIQGPMGCWNFACFGATCGVLILSIKEKNRSMKQLAAGALAAGLLGGVSEPSLFGIHLRYRRAYKPLVAGCVVGGITIAAISYFFPSSVSGSGVTANAFAFTSLLTIPVFNQVWVYAISIAVAFIFTTIAVVIMDYRTPEEKEEMLAKIAEENSDNQTI